MNIVGTSGPDSINLQVAGINLTCNGIVTAAVKLVETGECITIHRQVEDVLVMHRVISTLNSVVLKMMEVTTGFQMMAMTTFVVSALYTTIIVSGITYLLPGMRQVGT
jgi:hypothetical protein